MTTTAWASPARLGSGARALWTSPSRHRRASGRSRQRCARTFPNLQNIAFPVANVTSGGSAATLSQYGYWSNVGTGPIPLKDVLGNTMTNKVPASGGDIGIQFPTAPAACTLDGV